MKVLIPLLLILPVAACRDSSKGLDIIIPALGNSLQAEVVEVKDGHSLLVETNNLRIQIRLAGIASPGSRQPFADKSEQFLAEMTLHRTVTVTLKSREASGRIVAQVHLPDGNDVSLNMLRAGMAWHLGTVEDNAEFYAAEISARKAQLGLWKNPNPIPPWGWHVK